MGNTPSSQSVRSRTSQSSLVNSVRNARRSKAISFYATPPGSLDLEEGPFSSARSLPSTPTKAPDPATKNEVAESKRDDEQTARVWRPGVYTLVNAGSGAALDLSGGDKRSVIGFSSHYGPNQQWDFTPLGDGYIIRSVSSRLYLTVDDNVVSNGPAIIASQFPVTWKIKAAAEGGELFLRIFWPNEARSFDLANGTPGTKVQLVPYKPEEACQLWKVHEHEAHAEDDSESSKSESANELSVAGPPTETLVVSEANDCITTTRTTTTVTTVTTVTKTPRSAML